MTGEIRADDTGCDLVLQSTVLLPVFPSAGRLKGAREKCQNNGLVLRFRPQHNDPRATLWRIGTNVAEVEIEGEKHSLLLPGNPGYRGVIGPTQPFILYRVG